MLGPKKCSVVSRYAKASQYTVMASKAFYHLLKNRTVGSGTFAKLLIDYLNVRTSKLEERSSA